MKHYGKNEESSYLEYWDVNNLYRWATPQKLAVNDAKWVEDISEFNEDFIQSYNDESDKVYFLEVDVKYHEDLHTLHTDLPFLPEKAKLEKVEKLVTKLPDKTEHGLQIRNLKQ